MSKTRYTMGCTTCIVDTFHYPYRVACTRKHAEIDGREHRGAWERRRGWPGVEKRQEGWIRWKAIAGGLSFCMEAALYAFRRVQSAQDRRPPPSKTTPIFDDKARNAGAVPSARGTPSVSPIKRQTSIGPGMGLAGQPG